MRRPIFPVVFALAVVLAGCNGIAFGGDETSTPAVTPAAVPTDEPTPTPVPQLAPGLTGREVTDAFALAEAHRSVLENTSYSHYSDFTVQYPNGTVLNHVTIRERIAANRSRFYTVQNGFGMAVPRSGGVSMWSNGERVLRAITRNNSTSYGVPRSVDGEPVPPREVLSLGISDERIATFFSSAETRVSGRERRNGTTLYRVEATNVTNPTAFENGALNDPRNVTFRALISTEGLVREYRLRYTATLSGERVPAAEGDTVRVHRRVHYTGVGNTAVERPSWYGVAIENVSTTTPETAA